MMLRCIRFLFRLWLPILVVIMLHGSIQLVHVVPLELLPLFSFDDRYTTEELQIVSQAVTNNTSHSDTSRTHLEYLHQYDFVWI